MQIEAAALANDLIDHDPLILGIEPGKAVTVDFMKFDGDPVAVAVRAENWLRRLPCPSIALTSAPMRLKGFDLSVSSLAEVERVEAAAANNPAVSTIRVQARGPSGRGMDDNDWRPHQRAHRIALRPHR